MSILHTFGVNRNEEGFGGASWGSAETGSGVRFQLFTCHALDLYGTNSHNTICYVESSIIHANVR